MYPSGRFSRVLTSAMGRRRTWDVSKSLTGPTPVRPLPCKRPPVGGMGLPMARPRMGLLARTGATGAPTIWSPLCRAPLSPPLGRPPLSPLSRLYSSNPSNPEWSKVKADWCKRKVELLTAQKHKAKLYLSEALKAIVTFIKIIAQKIWHTLQIIAKHSAHQVAAGWNAQVSQIYFYSCLFGVGAFVLWLLNLLVPPSNEGNDSGIRKWHARLEELLKRFPENTLLRLAEVFLKEVMEWKELAMEFLKMLQAQIETMQEVRDDMSEIKAEQARIQKTQEEIRDKLEAILKTKSSD